VIFISRIRKIPYEENHRIKEDGIVEKLCSICSEWIIMNKENFYINKKNKTDGYYPECKRCSIERSSKWQKDNHDVYLKSIKKYYKNNKEISLIKRKSYVEKHKEECYDYSKQWRKSEHGKEKYRIYQKKRQEKKHEIYDIEWNNCKKYFNYECAYCGLSIDKHYFIYSGEVKLYDFHKEHVIDDGKNDLSNCIPSCSTCNSQKNTKTLNEYYDLNNYNYTYERYFKIYQWIRYDYKEYIMPKRRYKRQHLKARLKEIENNKSKRSSK